MQWLTVYDPETDEILAAGPSYVCATALGLTPATLRSYLSRARQGRSQPYVWTVEDTGTGRIQTYPKQPQKEDPS